MQACQSIFRKVSALQLFARKCECVRIVGLGLTFAQVKQQLLVGKSENVLPRPLAEHCQKCSTVARFNRDRGGRNASCIGSKAWATPHFEWRSSSPRIADC